MSNGYVLHLHPMPDLTQWVWLVLVSEITNTITNDHLSINFLGQCVKAKDVTSISSDTP